MNAHKLILPGVFFGICAMLGMVSMLTASPGTGQVSGASNATVVSAAQNNAPVQAAAPENCSISRKYPSVVQRWCHLIERYARQHGLDPNLVSAVMLQESAGEANAYSKSGAVGLMQVMPRDGKAARFMCKNGPCFADRPSMEQLFDPEFNVAYGTQMLADLIRRHGNVRDALRAYGPKDVGYYYADLVIGIFNDYQ